MALIWTWEEFWNWYRQLETDEERKFAMRELYGDGWLARLTPDVQSDVMLYAPMEILHSLQHFPNVFSDDTLELIQYKLRIRRKRK